MNKLTRDAELLLLDIVASVDALFTPIRFQVEVGSAAAAAIVERRSRFTKRGVPIVVGGDSAARMRGSRIVDTLVSAGLVQTFGGIRDRGARLTSNGDNYARSLFATKRVDESWAILQKIHCIAKSFARRRAGEMVLELDILEISDRVSPARFMDQLRKLEDECLPLLAAGLLESHSDTVGLVGYQVTDRGRAALSQTKPKRPKTLPAYKPELADAFISRYIDELNDRTSWEPLDRTLVYVPLSAGDWPERPRRKR